MRKRMAAREYAAGRDRYVAQEYASYFWLFRVYGTGIKI
jgi:hypothetical protein